MHSEFKLIKNIKKLKADKALKIKKTKNPLRKAILKYHALKRIINKVEFTRKNVKKNQKLIYPLNSRKHRYFKLLMLFTLRKLKKQSARSKIKSNN